MENLIQKEKSKNITILEKYIELFPMAYGLSI